jgi:hypothetical protein
MTVSAPDNGFNARPHHSRKKSCFVARKYLRMLSYPPRLNLPLGIEMNKIKTGNDRSRKRISNGAIAFVAASMMLAVGLLASSPARADGSVGSVTQINGNAQIERGGATLAAQQGTPVMVHDKVSTQPGASVTLEFNDGSSIVLIGSTSVAVEDMTAVNGQPVPSHVTLISGDIGTIVPDEAGEPHSVEVTSPNAKAIGASPNQ